MRMQTALVAMAIASLLGACATMPPVTMHYYQPEARTRVQVVQTAFCNTLADRVHVANAVTASTSYTRDIDRPETFELADLNDDYGDADIGFTFTEDGRLKAVNATTTGQGGEILKGAIGLISSVVGAVPLEAGEKTPCEWIEVFGDGKPVTLTYSLDADQVAALGATGARTILIADPGSQPLYARISEVLPVLTFSRQREAPVLSAASYTPDEDHAGMVMLTLTGHQTIGYQMTAGYSATATPAPFWTGSVLTPHGDFELPIPRAALFGKQGFALALSESGAIASLSYARQSGAAGVLGAVTNVVDALAPRTAAEQAADLEARADLIAQQQRLVLCEARPDECE